MNKSNTPGNHNLTRGVTCAGCAAKLDSKSLHRLLKNQKYYRSPNALLGPETSDDAGAYRLKSGETIVQTTDFFPPIVDDPFSFGQIATANSLSDLYVMGAKPITALNICCFPPDKYPDEVFLKIFEGSAQKLAEAECTLIGGHTIEDTELKFGLAVTGVLSPDETLIRNDQAKPGDSIFLTKPLGTGIVTTAIKGELCPEKLAGEAISSMAALNKKATEIMHQFNIECATDVTGFGLTGHLNEICSASNVGAVINFNSLPVFNGVFDLIDTGMLPAGSYKNKENTLPYVELKNNPYSDIIFDAQTSGGVLMAVPEEKKEELKNTGIGQKIGKFTPRTGDEKYIKIT
ncbi:MAG: selenide, water dikinase SelD [Elusimicrobiota bacterium]|nr:selenide, water dikinase SelD [Elusimicrobiota bacterium]